jgi:hypothetical protein
VAGWVGVHLMGAGDLRGNRTRNRPPPAASSPVSTRRSSRRRRLIGGLGLQCVDVAFGVGRVEDAIAACQAADWCGDTVRP